MLRIEYGSGDGRKQNGSERAAHEVESESGNGLAKQYSDAVVANAKKIAPSTGPADGAANTADGSSNGDAASSPVIPQGDGKAGKQAVMEGTGEKAKVSGSSQTSSTDALSGASRASGIHSAFPSSAELLQGLKV